MGDSEYFSKGEEFMVLANGDGGDPHLLFNYGWIME
jgi:hypothetical protein